MSIRRQDPWAIGAFVMWLLMLCLGVFPELTFQFMRGLGGVVSQTAWVNNPMMLVVILAGLIGIFAWQRASEAKAHPATAQAIALQLTICALVAFSPFLPIHFIRALERPMIDIVIIYGMGMMKGLCWLYILSLFFRYYVLHSYGVFGSMQSLFPSGRQAAKDKKESYEKTGALYDSTGE